MQTGQSVVKSACPFLLQGRTSTVTLLKSWADDPVLRPEVLRWLWWWWWWDPRVIYCYLFQVYVNFSLR